MPITDIFSSFSVDPEMLAYVSKLVLTLLIGAGLSLILAWHFIKFGRTYSNRRELAQVFPLVMLAIVFIISVVKSSLALSLGLVGALSIVRFRTPIKEPEELAYLFIAIAIGIGLGADQILATLAATVTILGLLMIRSLGVRKTEPHNLFINVEVPEHNSEESSLRILNAFLSQQTPTFSLRRLDVRDGMMQATYFVDCESNADIVDLMEGLKTELPGAAISFVEQGGIPGR